MASRCGSPVVPAASRTNWSCVEKRTRGVVSEAWVSVLRGGRHTATPSTACCIGCSWSAWPIQRRRLQNCPLKAWYKRKFQHSFEAQTGAAHGSRGGKGRPQLAAPQQLALPGLAASSSAADRNLEFEAKGEKKKTRGTEQESAPRQGECGSYVTSSRKPRGSEHAPRKPRQWNLLCLPRRSL